MLSMRERESSPWQQHMLKRKNLVMILCCGKLQNLESHIGNPLGERSACNKDYIITLMAYRVVQDGISSVQ